MADDKTAGSPGLTSRIGVMVYEPPTDAGRVFNPAIDLLHRRGVPVGGVAQRSGAPDAGRRPSLWIDHIETGRTRRLDRPRGPGSRACILVPCAWSGVVRRDLFRNERRKCRNDVGCFGARLCQ